jgi:hypothetical protein
VSAAMPATPAAVKAIAIGEKRDHVGRAALAAAVFGVGMGLATENCSSLTGAESGPRSATAFSA